LVIHCLDCFRCSFPSQVQGPFSDVFKKYFYYLFFIIAATCIWCKKFTPVDESDHGDLLECPILVLVEHSEWVVRGGLKVVNIVELGSKS
jgi:hypothetical protein